MFFQHRHIRKKLYLRLHQILHAWLDICPKYLTKLFLFDSQTMNNFHLANDSALVLLGSIPNNEISSFSPLFFSHFNYFLHYISRCDRPRIQIYTHAKVFSSHTISVCVNFSWLYTTFYLTLSAKFQPSFTSRHFTVSIWISIWITISFNALKQVT